MPFPNRQDAYRWLEASSPEGPCGLVIANGGFFHHFLHEGGSVLLYLGMRGK